MAHQAQDTFVAELEGGPVLIQKGAILPSNHPAVKLHGKTALFAPWDAGEDEVPVKRPRGRPRKNPVAVAEADRDGNEDEGGE